MSADPIVPDTKDWTWTVGRRCPECGFDASRVSADRLPDTLRALTAPWGEVLARDTVAERPAPTTWSPLEYACHIHEVLDVFAGRFALVREQDNPTLPNWDQDRAATDGAYAGQEPARIAQEIPRRTEALIEVLRGYGQDADWERTTVRSDGATFTALTLGRYLVHDLAHHLTDVGVPIDVG